MDISDRPFTQEENEHQEAVERLVKTLGQDEWVESTNGYLRIVKGKIKMAKKIKTKGKKIKY